MGFTMILEPKATSERRGASNFRSCSNGIVRLKCDEAELDAGSSVTFRIVLSGIHAHRPRGPVRYDFSQGLLCGLPNELEEWHLLGAVESESSTFSIRLEVPPVHNA